MPYEFEIHATIPRYWITGLWDLEAAAPPAEPERRCPPHHWLLPTTHDLTVQAVCRDCPATQVRRPFDEHGSLRRRRVNPGEGLGMAIILEGMEMHSPRGRSPGRPRKRQED